MSTTLTYTDMILLVPAFLSEDLTRQAQVTAAIVRAERSISETAFGYERDDAILFLAAHNLAMVDRSNVANAGGSGAVTGRTSGESITSYSNQTKGDGYDRWRVTPYGAQYLDILFGLADLSPIVSA